MRQQDSPICHTPGITFRRRGSSILEINIDIQHERQLRADGKPTGGIKKERIVRVYPKNIEAFMKSYDQHMALLKKTNFDPNYAPMFVDSKGQAMRKAAYYKRFIQLVNKRLIPALLDSDDPVLVEYGLDLQFLHLRPHCFRHWFTTALVLDGLTAEVIADYRGDSNTGSAETYLRNKGALRKRLEAVHDVLIDKMKNESEPIVK